MTSDGGTPIPLSYGSYEPSDETIGVLIAIADRVHHWRFITRSRRNELAILLADLHAEIVRKDEE